MIGRVCFIMSKFHQVGFGMANLNCLGRWLLVIMWLNKLRTIGKKFNGKCDNFIADVGWTSGAYLLVYL